MDRSRIPKIASEYNLTRRREVGHPRKRWALLKSKQAKGLTHERRRRSRRMEEKIMMMMMMTCRPTYVHHSLNDD